MKNLCNTIAALLENLETEMQRTGLWEQGAPAKHVLNSEQPFCFDTMTVAQWLQWRFLPRMYEIVADEGAGMPTESAIAPYVEEALGDHAADTDQIIFLLSTFDDLISQVQHRRQ